MGQIRGRHQPVAVGIVLGCAGQGNVPVLDGNGGIVAVGIVGEGVLQSLAGGGSLHIVPVVVGILHLRPVGQDFLCQVVVAVLIRGFLALGILHADNIAVLVVGIAAAEFLPEQLDAVEVCDVVVVVVRNLYQEVKKKAMEFEDSMALRILLSS